MYYFATPHANTNVKKNEPDPKKLDRNTQLANFFEENGIDIFLPARDADQSLPGKRLLELELDVIRKSEGMIVALSDTRGIYLEAGYAKALGKKVIGLKVQETREFSEWGKAFFDFMAQNEKEVLSYLKKTS
jgi:nucleoside 2-deoxyribosyltransferase